MSYRNNLLNVTKESVMSTRKALNSDYPNQYELLNKRSELDSKCRRINK